MRPSLKKTLMTLTMLSAGALVFAPCSAEAAMKKPKAKDPAPANSSFAQYPKLGEAKDDVNAAITLHKTAASLLADKERLESYKAEVEKYNEIDSRLKQNENCNKTLLNEYFTNGSAIWTNISAWAEDTAKVMLAKASDSFGDSSEANAQLKALESGQNVEVKADNQFANVNENTSEDEIKAMTKKGQSKADSYKSDIGGSSDELIAYGKIRWDIGTKVLKDIYANPTAWGTQKKKFTPWVDQKHVYDVYLDKRYAEMEKSFAPVFPATYPARPKMAANATYLPEDSYSGTVPAPKASARPYSPFSADDVWCGAEGTKAKDCTRINKGAFILEHQKYVMALKALPLKSGAMMPAMELPYLPQAPLPPWRETVYILNVEKQIPEMGSALPDPWFRVTQSIDNFTNKGELANLVEKSGNTVRYRPGDYDKETGEIKKPQNLPLPLSTNRISSYLALKSAKTDQEPIKDRALASIKELNENIITTLAKAGYNMPNPDSFDLSKDADYKKAISKLAELQNQKISSAQAKLAALTAQFGASLLPSVSQTIDAEKATMAALQKDTEFLINVTRDNAPQINSLISNAIADNIATQAYKDNVNTQMQGATPVPAVGCPVL